MWAGAREAYWARLKNGAAPRGYVSSNLTLPALNSIRQMLDRLSTFD
jgi:hypothetical protein